MYYALKQFEYVIGSLKSICLQIAYFYFFCKRVKNNYVFGIIKVKCLRIKNIAVEVKKIFLHKQRNKHLYNKDMHREEFHTFYSETVFTCDLLS